jgi:hypothetical protein
MGDYSNIGSHGSINLIQAEMMAVPEVGCPWTLGAGCRVLRCADEASAWAKPRPPTNKPRREPASCLRAFQVYVNAHGSIPHSQDIRTLLTATSFGKSSDPSTLRLTALAAPVILATDIGASMRVARRDWSHL